MEDKIADKIIASCEKVYKELGPGYAERIYHSALKVVLEEDKLDFTGDEDFSVLYKDIRVGSFKCDFIIEDKVFLDVNAVSSELTADQELKLKAELKAANKKLGLLVNFGAPKLVVKKINN